MIDRPGDIEGRETNDELTTFRCFGPGDNAEHDLPIEQQLADHPDRFGADPGPGRIPRPDALL